MSPLVDIDRIRARLAVIEAEREPLLALIRAAEAYEKIVGRTLFSNPGGGARTASRSEGAGRAAPIMAATETAVAEALEVMGPMSTSDLTLVLAGRPELNLPQNNPINVLSARLSNSKRFDNQRGVGWWFKDRPWPARFVPHGIDIEEDDEELA